MRRAGFVTADYIVPYNRNGYVTIGPIAPPSTPSDPASREYVDSHTSIPPNIVEPLYYNANDGGTLGVHDASDTSAGVLTTGEQHIAGQKSFDVAPIVPAVSNPLAYTNEAAPVSFVRDACRGAQYEACNGWISGGVVSVDPGGTSFSITAVTCRFTDYTDEVHPVATDVVTVPSKTGLSLAYLGEPNVSVMMDSSGTITQRPTGFDTTLLNIGLLRLARLVVCGGTIRGVSNDKYPLASRYSNVGAEFSEALAPINVTGNEVYPSGLGDLSINLGPGVAWYQSANACTDRTTPSLLTNAGAHAPALLGVWMDSTGDVHYEDSGNEMDLERYNPGGMSASLVDLPEQVWVNIPILYDAGANVCAFQYATEYFESQTSARMSVGSFRRLRAMALKSFVVVGYATAPSHATELLAGMLSPGEYTNYCTGKKSAAMDMYETVQSNTAWVDYGAGDDSTGTVTRLDRPYKTFNAAAAAIKPIATEDNTCVINSAPGLHMDASLHLIPYVSWCALPSACAYRVMSGKVELDASFATTDGAEVTLYDLNLDATDLFIDLQSPGGSAGSEVAVLDTVVEGDLVYMGRGLADVLELEGSHVEGSIDVDGGSATLTACTNGALPRSTFTASVYPCAATLWGNTFGDITMRALDANIRLSVSVRSCRILGTLTVDGAGVALRIDRTSVPTTFIVTNGATITYTGRGVTDDQMSALDAAVPALSASNAAVSESRLTAVTSTKADNTVTVNGHPLSTGTVVVRAGDLPAIDGGGTRLDHSLLPALVAGDIPGTIDSNTTGRSSNLTAGLNQTLPDGVRAVTKPAGDSTTAIATTAFITGQKGVPNGVASLNALGKVPAEQIDTATLGALTYKGTWDASTGIYPPATIGHFYIALIAGTIDGVTYNVGDWMVYNGTVWDRVPTTDVVSYMATWPGSAHVTTVGTVTSGEWRATTIASDKGGAGAVSGVLTADGAGNVSTATDSVVVLNGTDADITGVKTFADGVKVPTAADLDDSGSDAASTAWVQACANVRHVSVVFRAASGSDDPPNDGSNLNRAVRTVSRAAALCTPHDANHCWRIHCIDAGRMVEDVTVPEYVVLTATAAVLEGTVTLGDFTTAEMVAIQNPPSGVGVLFSGGVGAGSAYVRSRALINGRVTAVSGQGSCCANIDEILQPTVDTLAIYCNGTTLSPTTLHVRSLRVRGLVRAEGSGSTIDMSQAADVSEATFETLYGGVIIYPARGVGNVTGILKGDGIGNITPATAGSDYLIQNNVITLSGTVTGSGRSAISTAIANGSVALSKLSSMTSGTLVGNMSGSGASPQEIAAGYTAAPGSVVVRSAADGGCFASHFSELVATVTAGGTAHNTYLTPSDAAVQEIIGDLDENVWLPDATTVSNRGLQFTIRNANSVAGTVTLRNHLGTSTCALLPGESVRALCDDTSSEAGSWLLFRGDSVITLSGPITGTGTRSISTSVATNSLALSALNRVPAHRVLGNPLGVEGDVTTVGQNITLTGSVTGNGNLGDPAITCAIVPGSVTYGTGGSVADLPANTLLANTTGSSAAAAAVSTALQLTGSVTGTGSVGGGAINCALTAGSVTYGTGGTIANVPARTFLANTAGTTAPPDAASTLLNASGDVTGSVYLGSGGALSLTLGTGTVTYGTGGKMAQLPPRTLLANTSALAYAAPDAVSTAVTLSGSVTGSGYLGAGAVNTSIAAGVVTHGSGGSLADMAAYSVLGNDTALAAYPRAVSTYISLDGVVVGTGRLGGGAISTSLTSGSVTYGTGGGLATIPAQTLLGNLGGTAAQPTSVTAAITLNGAVTGTGYVGTPITTSLSGGSVSYGTGGSIANMPARTLLANVTGSSAPPQAYSTLTSLGGAITGSGYLGDTISTTLSAGAVTYAALQSMPAYTVLGNPNGLEGTPTSVSSAVTLSGAISGSGHVGGTIAATHTNLGDTLGAVLGALPGSAVVVAVPVRYTRQASSVLARDAYGNAAANAFSPAISNYADAAITLTVASTQTQRYTGATTSTITLPTTLSVGEGFYYNLVNDGTNTVTVRDSGTATVGSVASGQRARVLAAVAGTPGTWAFEYASSTQAPTLLWRNAFTSVAPGTYVITGTSTVLMTAAGMYEGPVSVSKTGGGTGILQIADATSGSNMLGYLAGVLGAVPVGTNWMTRIYCLSTGFTLASPSGSVTLLGVVSGKAIGGMYVLHCWVTSSTTYTAISV